MFTMWNETVRPALIASQPSPRVICHRRIKCFGVGESDLEAMLPDMIRRKREPLVGITVHGATITLRITASGPNETACQQAMQPTAEEIYKLLGVLVYGEDDDELEHAVVRLLTKHNRSLAVAEWATDGMISHWLAEAAAANICFQGGIDIHSATMLSSLLNVNVAEYATASAETASLMARAIQHKTGADYGLGVAAFPTAGASIPTATLHNVDMGGTLHVALASADSIREKAFPIATHPSITKVRSAKQALNMVRLALLNGKN
jgi:nicotinamide-nucleotide amidase